MASKEHHQEGIIIVLKIDFIHINILMGAELETASGDLAEEDTENAEKGEDEEEEEEEGEQVGDIVESEGEETSCSHNLSQEDYDKKRQWER